MSKSRKANDDEAAAKWIYRIATDRKLRDSLMREAVREALLAHKKAGNPVVSYENGRIVIVPASEINV